MSNLDFIAPTKPIAPWIGGKFHLSDTIIPIINQIPHTTYVEPFVGMGGIFLRRDRKPKAEVINDLNGELVNLFRILQRHYPQFMDTLKFQITSRKEFERLSIADPNTLTDLEKAARFIYLQRLAFNGKPSGQNFAVAIESPARFDLTKLASMLDDVHSRLSSVVIENLSYQECIKRYDRASTLFYLDPPYWNCEDYYGADLFSRDDFNQLRDTLKRIDGIFIMSLNDLPAVRDQFVDFHINTVNTVYSASTTDENKNVSEVLISNRPLDMTPAQQSLSF